MREAFAHEAVVVMSADDDVNALGGAITVALCGSWDHDPPCGLAPHYTSSTRPDGGILVRVLFATDPDNEQLVRDRIETALAAGESNGPDGAISRWELVSSHRANVAEAETDHAQRLITS